MNMYIKKIISHCSRIIKHKLLVLFVGVTALWGTNVIAGPLPVWDTTIPEAVDRFEVLASFQDQAVLDKETGLVWDREPSTLKFTYGSAERACYRRKVGGANTRRGWRLPTMSELLSLTDETQISPPLPNGHPFNLGAEYSDEENNGRNNLIWTQSVDGSSTDVPPNRYVILFTTDPARDSIRTTTRRTARTFSNSTAFAWCVRGGVAN